MLNLITSSGSGNEDVDIAFGGTVTIQPTIVGAPSQDGALAGIILWASRRKQRKKPFFGNTLKQLLFIEGSRERNPSLAIL